jgi:hypothetical protein
LLSLVATTYPNRGVGTADEDEDAISNVEHLEAATAARLLVGRV